jgi:nitric oxide synthase-interacting protein
MRARDPVSCSSGDLFCRECAVENLLAQRKEIKRMQTEIDRRAKEDEEERQLQEEEARDKAVKDFELLQMGLEIKSRQRGRKGIIEMAPKVVGRVDGKILLEEEFADATMAKEEARGTKRKFELDEEELLRLAREERQKAKVALTDEKVKRTMLHSPGGRVKADGE